MAGIDDILKANADYAAGFTQASLPMPPGRKVAVIT